MQYFHPFLPLSLIHQLPCLFFSLTGEKAQSQIPLIMPDYMLVFAVPILANQPSFKDITDTTELLNIRSCLWFILEPLMIKNETYSFGFYKALIEQMKNHKDAIRPEDELSNQVSLVCWWFPVLFFLVIRVWNGSWSLYTDSSHTHIHTTFSPQITLLLWVFSFGFLLSQKSFTNFINYFLSATKTLSCTNGIVHHFSCELPVLVSTPILQSLASISLDFQ